MGDRMPKTRNSRAKITSEIVWTYETAAQTHSRARKLPFIINEIYLYIIILYLDLTYSVIHVSYTRVWA